MDIVGHYVRSRSLVSECLMCFWSGLLVTLLALIVCTRPVIVLRTVYSSV